jgi:hypothetical protein
MILKLSQTAKKATKNDLAGYHRRQSQHESHDTVVN